MRRWGAPVLAAVAATLASCAHEKPKIVAPPPPKLAEPIRRGHVTESPPDWYWEAILTDVDARPTELPPTADAIARVEGGARVWDDLGDAGRERLRRDGIVVLGDAPGDAPRWQMGAFYTEWRERRVPYVITLDALLTVAHTALTRALADIETREIAPLLDAMLTRMDARLAADQKGAKGETLGGYRLARGVVAVARLLADERYVPSADLAGVVREEKQKIDAHAGVATSPLLGLPIDYARFAATSPRATHHVMTWLTVAPFALVGRTEGVGAPLDVGAVRHHARAAMLVARLADHDVDASIHGAFSRLARLFTFVWGPADDLTPLTLGDLADSGGIDLAKPENIANVVRVDKVRALARTTRTPALSDSSARGITMRFLGAHAPVDGIALKQRTPNALPMTEDLATWLGHPLAEDEASHIHASLHGSLVDVLMTWSTSKRAPTKIVERARAESMLAAWSMVRHTASSFGCTKPAPPPPQGPREILVSGAALPAFVEPDTETIARLVATIRQAHRGLAALGPLAKGTAADVELSEAEDIAKVALAIAEREARDEALTPAETSALAALPGRIAAFETEAGETGGPYAAVIHTDPASSTALVSSSGAIEPAVVVAREPGTGRFVLAVGAHLAHFEATLRTDQLEGPAALLERRIKDGKATRTPTR